MQPPVKNKSLNHYTPKYLALSAQWTLLASTFPLFPILDITSGYTIPTEDFRCGGENGPADEDDFSQPGVK